MFGREYDVPRDQFVKVFFNGAAPVGYVYSGQSVPVVEEFPQLSEIRRMVEDATGSSTTLCWSTDTRTARTGGGWHADDEPIIDQSSPIASVWSADRATLTCA